MDGPLLCHLCQPIRGISPWRSHDPHPLCLQTASDLFHGPCNKCSSLETRGRLCSMCVHLRLQHLLTCYIPNRRDTKPASIQVSLGSLKHIAGVQSCSLHHLFRLVVQTFLEAFKPPKEVEFSIEIHMYWAANNDIDLIESGSGYSQCLTAFFTYDLKWDDEGNQTWPSDEPVTLPPPPPFRMPHKVPLAPLRLQKMFLASTCTSRAASPLLLAASSDDASIPVHSNAWSFLVLRDARLWSFYAA